MARSFDMIAEYPDSGENLVRAFGDEHYWLAWLAAEYPERVRALVLAAPSASCLSGPWRRTSGMICPSDRG